MGNRMTMFVNIHKDISDEDFILYLNCKGDDKETVLSIRGAIADMCGVQSSLIHPWENTMELAKLMELKNPEEAWDEMAFIVILEKRSKLGIITDDLVLPPFVESRLFFVRIAGPENLGRWVLETVERLRGRFYSLGDEKTAMRDLGR